METKPDEVRPPYLPFQTFLSFLSELGSKPLPPQIDRSLMASKSGTDQASLFATLKFFGLIDESQVVQHELRVLTQADEEGRKAHIGAMLRGKYPRQFKVSEDNGTEKLLLDSFEEEWGYTGDTRRKAMTFFLHGARWSGITLSPHFPTTRMGSGRPANGRPKRTPRKRPGLSTAGGTSGVTRHAGGGEEITVTLGDAGTVTLKVDVRWLELPDATFTSLRQLVKTLQGLGEGSESGSAETAEEEDEQ